MLTIDRLRLQLPPGYQHRAAAIGRQLALELARMPLARDLHLDRLQLPQVNIPPGAGNGRIVRQIATAVHDRIARTKR